MFRKQLESDLKEVFGFQNVRLCGIDDESEVIYFNPQEIVSEADVGSGKTHFRVYGTLGINQDEANGTFGFLQHRLWTSTSPIKGRFQLQGDEIATTQTLYEQHRILSSVACVWDAYIEWNKAPDVDGGTIEQEVVE